MPHGFHILDATGQFLLVYSNRKLLGLGEIVKGRPKDFYDSVLRTYTLRASGFPEVEDPHLVNELKLFYAAVARARS